MTAESAADEGRVDASYALVRVFVWAVPTLGFIGTVLGLGAAVGGFSESLEAAGPRRPLVALRGLDGHPVQVQADQGEDGAVGEDGAARRAVRHYLIDEATEEC